VPWRCVCASQGVAAAFCHRSLPNVEQRILHVGEEKSSCHGIGRALACQGLYKEMPDSKRVCQGTSCQKPLLLSQSEQALQLCVTLALYQSATPR